MLCSCGVVWTALLSLLLMNSRLNARMCIGVLLTFVGLAVKGSSMRFSFKDREAVGSLLTLCGVVVQSLTNVLTEKFLTDRKMAVGGQNFVFIHGVVNSTVLSLWLLYTAGFPGSQRWSDTFVGSIRDKQGSLPLVLIGYGAMLAASILRSSILWILQKHAGAIAVNVLKGLRSAVAIFLSHLLYCGIEESQCLTPSKCLAAAACVLGVVLFGKGKQALDAEQSVSAHDSKCY
eukprot:GHVU01088098.1.p1 GENE.GHVU01088098.1~~GHVU01088098.1.p1  ORF type:complete len:233 (+),score=19.57 GHVU01088098.1:885-1583(+)